MCDVILFPKHKLLKCRCEPGDSCAVCEWDAAICNTCGGAEGSLTTHCPQARLTNWQHDQVMAHTIDFVNGDWRMVKRTLEVEKL